MHKIKVAFLLGLISFVAHADPSFTAEKPVLCADPKTIIESVSGPDWSEEPLWTGIGEKDSKYVIMSNNKTKTWSIIQFNSSIACVLGTGDGSTVIKFNKNTLQARN